MKKSTLNLIFIGAGALILAFLFFESGSSILRIGFGRKLFPFIVVIGSALVAFGVLSYTRMRLWLRIVLAIVIGLPMYMAFMLFAWWAGCGFTGLCI